MSLSTLVEKIPDLLKLRLFCTRVDLDAARCLATALKRNTDMKSLHLFQCNLESDREILSVILQSNVKAIHLDRNNIGGNQGFAIPRGQPAHSELSLGANGFNDDDAIILSQALKRNTNLKEISQ